MSPVIAAMTLPLDGIDPLELPQISVRAASLVTDVRYRVHRTPPNPR